MPGGADAVVDIAKLRDYCLNPRRPRGRHEARVFASRLGLVQTDAEFLRSQLLQAAQDADAREGDVDEHGKRYVIDSAPGSFVEANGSPGLRTSGSFAGRSAPVVESLAPGVYEVEFSDDAGRRTRLSHSAPTV